MRQKDEAAGRANSFRWGGGNENSLASEEESWLVNWFIFITLRLSEAQLGLRSTVTEHNFTLCAVMCLQQLQQIHVTEM